MIFTLETDFLTFRFVNTGQREKMRRLSGFFFSNQLVLCSWLLVFHVALVIGGEIFTNPLLVREAMLDDGIVVEYMQRIKSELPEMGELIDR